MILRLLERLTQQLGDDDIPLVAAALAVGGAGDGVARGGLVRGDVPLLRIQRAAGIIHAYVHR